MIKNISFDLWLTLIKSHPLFKRKRAEFLWKEFNPQHISLEEIIGIVQKIDKKCDWENEQSGTKIPAEMMYGQILLELQLNPEKITAEILSEIKIHNYHIFNKYPPAFLNDEIENMLRKLNEEGYSLNLSSNTGFIESDCLVEVLKNMNLYQFFGFCVFSDEINASKPSERFFNKVFDHIPNDKDEVIHIGDNYQADFIGAQNFGFHALLIQNEQYSYLDIKKHLHEKSRKF